MLKLCDKQPRDDLLSKGFAVNPELLATSHITRFIKFPPNFLSSLIDCFTHFIYKRSYHCIGDYGRVLNEPNYRFGARFQLWLVLVNIESY